MARWPNLLENGMHSASRWQRSRFQRVGGAQGRRAFAASCATSASRPMPNADVFVVPGNRHARTDSTGRFAFDSLEAGHYIVRARRVGYGPAEWSVDLSKSGHADVQFLLGIEDRAARHRVCH